MKIMSKKDYLEILRKVQLIPFNTHFATAVLEEKIGGAVYADSLESPSSFYIVHEYGMSLLFGELSDDFLEKQFLPHAKAVNQLRRQKEMMQIYPTTKESKINELLHIYSPSNLVNDYAHNRFKYHRRINFCFNQESYCKRDISNLASGLSISSMSESTFESFGQSVAPRFFWKSFAQLEMFGKGFELVEEGKVIGVAFSAFVVGMELELSMEIIPQKRKIGYGSLISSVLIDYCIEQNILPVWSCGFSNKSSYNLAQGLGFIPTLDLPYYEIA